jgi:hypothetical protein
MLCEKKQGEGTGTVFYVTKIAYSSIDNGSNLKK